MRNTRECPVTVCELYEELTELERRFLSREFKLARRVPASLAFLRSMPYPLGRDTAAAVAALVRNYVYPWSDVRSRYLLSWVCDRLTGEDGICALTAFAEHPEEIAALFGTPEEFREYEEGTDFTYGLAGIRDAEVDEECDSLQRVLEAATEDGLFRLGLSVPLPLPLGPPSLTRVPLLDGHWIDRHLVELAEWCAELGAAGYCRMPALDPHPLAWYRFYPPGTDWCLATEASPAAGAEIRHQVGAKLNRFRGGTCEIDGRTYLDFDDYAGWDRRVVPGDLTARRTAGIVVASWNAWVEAGSDGGRIDLHGEVVTKLDHPGGLRAWSDYAGMSPASLESAERVRSATVAELRELAVDRTVRTDPAGILTQVQIQIIDALRRHPWISAEVLAEEALVSKQTLFNPGGLKELLNRDPPLVIRGPQKRGYALADVTPDVVRV
ncbi:Uncharacterized protein OS=Anaerobaculum mobile (strain ATCC BAA-54 / DSM 13181 / NGA) GN=Anamo_1175 PE=4 SV=1 [Gemmataceae bacterium]|nr:Uncharacterized protein OS=Anaerobaculum mobile (strain ATCC BAA-54 / DSM 13181 / NGA) GN=Anamo_1175 PE=4 SV=1 [Gemmataceae bacterium]VTT98781.1 Uncharacterized protein OS=Anaerobaculum mobile (strain ATCC BAA-54 / DSM 13181 / NGA) GN=Anamo_1175 PE=4 SV=1 [Gemmataceae bacterium]